LKVDKKRKKKERRKEGTEAFKRESQILKEENQADPEKKPG